MEHTFIEVYYKKIREFPGLLPRYLDSFCRCSIQFTAPPLCLSSITLSDFFDQNKMTRPKTLLFPAPNLSSSAMSLTVRYLKDLKKSRHRCHVNIENIKIRLVSVCHLDFLLMKIHPCIRERAEASEEFMINLIKLIFQPPFY